MSVVVHFPTIKSRPAAPQAPRVSVPHNRTLYTKVATAGVRLLTAAPLLSAAAVLALLGGLYLIVAGIWAGYRWLELQAYWDGDANARDEAEERGRVKLS